MNKMEKKYIVASARSQWRQRLRLLHSLALPERHENVAMKRQFV